MLDMSSAVFLSYASEDADAAARISESLRAAGIEVWFDKKELRGGDVWDHRIHQQIKECALFIPIVSQHTQQRLEGYFRLEWRLACDRCFRMAAERAFLIPVVIDSTRGRDAVVPDLFRTVQWTRLQGGEATAEFVVRISDLLSSEHTRETPSQSLAAHSRAPVRTLHPPPPPPPPRLSAKSLVSLASVLLLIGVAAYLGISRRWMSKLDLANVRPAALPVSEKSIAILPFADLSEKHNQEYLADGMAEEVLNVLAKVPELKVIGRTSSFSFKGKNLDARDIAKSLGARYVLEGSIRRSADRIRVTMQLLDATDGTHRWSETFERQTTDVFRLEDEIAVRTAAALNLTITSYSNEVSESVNPDAYDDYVRGLHELQDVTETSVDRALALFTRALAVEPGFSKALEGIATARLFICVDGWKDHRSACESAKVSANAAIAAAPHSPDAYAIRAELRTVYDWDWMGAEADIHEAESLGGGESTEFAAARLAYALGDMDRARQHLDNILSRSPFDANAMLDRGGLVEYRAGQFQEAESWLRRGLAISPHFSAARFSLGLALLAQGKGDEALEQMKQTRPDEGRFEGLAVAYHALGRYKEADDAFLQAAKYAPPAEQSMLARVCAYRGDSDRAFAYLEAAYRNHDNELWWMKGDWLFNNLIRDSRYAAFLHKMNLEE